MVICMEGQKVERNKTVKCLHILIACMGVFLDDGLKWKEQVESVRRQCFAGLARLRRLRDVFTLRGRYTMPTATPGLLFCSVAGMHKGAKGEVREWIQNCGMQIILSQPPRTPSGQLRKQLKWMSLEKKGNGPDGSSSKLCNEESSTLYKKACRQLLRLGVGWHWVLTTSNSLCPM